MGKAAIDAPRKDTFLVDPADLVIISDKAHPLYDKRCELPVNPGLVASIRAHGFRSTILCFKDGEKLIVLDGRQRTRAAVQANEEIKAAGGELVRVRVMLERGDESQLYAIQCLTNENRQDDSDVTKAEKLQRYLAFGRSEAEAIGIFGSAVKVRALLALLDCAAPVRAAVAAGKISTSAATKLVKLERADQVAELAKLVEASGGRRVKVREAQVQAAKAQAAKTGATEADAGAAGAPGRKEIKRLVAWDAEAKRLTPEECGILLWVLTGKSAGMLADCIAEAGKKRIKAPKEPKAASETIPASDYQLGDLVTYRQGRGTFQATVTVIEGSMLTLKRIDDGKIVERPASKIEHAFATPTKAADALAAKTAAQPAQVTLFDKKAEPVKVATPGVATDPALQ